MNNGLTGLNLREWTRETKVKNPYIICFWKTQIFLASLKHNEPVRYTIEVAGLAPLEQRLCQPYFENLDKWHLAGFVRAPWLCLK